MGDCNHIFNEENREIALLSSSIFVADQQINPRHWTDTEPNQTEHEELTDSQCFPKS